MDMQQLAEQLYQAVRDGQWIPAIALVLVGTTYLARRYAPSQWTWLRTDRGGVALVLGTALLGALGNAMLAEGSLPDLRALWAAGLAAVAAIGGYTGLRRLVWPQE